METIILGFFIVAIVVAAVMLFNFDMEYTLPTIAENKDLSILNIIALGVAAVIFVSFFMKQYTVLVISLIIGGPFIVYVNFRTYFPALKKFFKKDSSPKG
jgi:hypothetical protein